MTGDKLGMAPRVIGGALWGRIGGFVSGIVNAVVNWFTGKDIGDHIYGALFGKPGESGDGTAVARAANPPSALSEKSLPATPAVDSTLPQLVLVPEKPSEIPAAPEPTEILGPRENMPLSSNSQLPFLVAIERPFIDPYMRARDCGEPDDDAPRVRVTA